MLGLSLVAASGGHSSSRCAGLSLSRPLLLQSTGSRSAGSVIVAHGPNCSAACGIFPDQGSNPCPLHWQADSQPLRHQGSPHPFLSKAVLLALQSPSVLVCCGCHDKVPPTGWCKYFLIVLEARSPRSMCQQDWFLLRPVSLARKWPSSPSAFLWFPLVHVCVLISSSYKDTSHVGLRPTLMTLF